MREGVASVVGRLRGIPYGCGIFGSCGELCRGYGRRVGQSRSEDTAPCSGGAGSHLHVYADTFTAVHVWVFRYSF